MRCADSISFANAVTSRIYGADTALEQPSAADMTVYCPATDGIKVALVAPSIDPPLRNHWLPELALDVRTGLAGPAKFAEMVGFAGLTQKVCDTASAARY